MQVGKTANLNVHKVAVTNKLMACQNYMRKREVRIYFMSYRYMYKNFSRMNVVSLVYETLKGP